MGIIWDDATQSHDIVVNGIVEANFPAASVNVIGSEKQIEDAEKIKMDAKLNSKGYVFFLHIVDKIGENYVIRKAPLGHVPKGEWWKILND